MKPVLFATGHVPPYRVGALAHLHDSEGIEVALFGGAMRHGGEGTPSELPFPVRSVTAPELARLCRSGGHRAAVVSTAGRAALLAGWGGARSAGLPVILWASLWAHPRTPAHALSYLPLMRLYRSADAVVTYGPHVSAYVRARGARNVHVAPQSVDNEFWRAAVAGGKPAGPAPGPRLVFVGRPAREKGLSVLLDAWRSLGARGHDASLVLVGDQPPGAGPLPPGAVSLGALEPDRLREVYAGAEMLVVPSVATRAFREPWGLVVNEAMNRGLAVVASDAVGAAAGGLVCDGRNGLVVRASDAGALAGAIGSLLSDRPRVRAMGAQGRDDVAAYSHEAWAQGFSQALATVGLSRLRW